MPLFVQFFFYIFYMPKLDSFVFSELSPIEGEKKPPTTAVKQFFLSNKPKDVQLVG